MTDTRIIQRTHDLAWFIKVFDFHNDMYQKTEQWTKNKIIIENFHCRGYISIKKQGVYSVKVYCSEEYLEGSHGGKELMEAISILLNEYCQYLGIDCFMKRTIFFSKRIKKAQCGRKLRQLFKLDSCGLDVYKDDE